MTGNVAISTYHEYILEAIFSLRQGLSYYQNSKLVPEDIGSDYSGITGEINCRYSFLMISNSLEAAANALLLSLKLNKEYYEELEKLNTLVKFKLFCDFSGKRLDQSNIIYGRVKDIISCRNEFVHPKPKTVNYNIDSKTTSIEYDIKKTKTRNYPLYFNEIKPELVLIALEDVLAFISWVCFDTCGLEIQDGSLRLGLNSYGDTADIDIIANEYNRNFDKRTFGRKK